MSSAARKAYNWCWDTANNAFPPIRIFFLAGAVFFYAADVVIDVYAAVEHYSAWKGGSETARDYFIATVVFIVVPSLLINAISLLLYVWAQCMDKRRARKGYQSYETKGDIPFHWIVSKKDSCLYKTESRIINYFRQIFQRNRSTTTESDIVLRNFATIGNVSENSPLQQETGFGDKEDEEDEVDADKNDSRRPLEALPSLVQSSDKSDSNAESDSSNIESPVPLLNEGGEGGERVINEAHPTAGLEEPDFAPFEALDNFSRSEFVFIVILHLLQLGFIYRVLRLLYLNCRRRDKLSFDRYKDISFLRLMEGFFESAPQLLLQLYVVTLEEIPDITRKAITGMAVVISMGSLALAIGDYISAEKDIDHYNPHGKKMARLSWGAYFLIIFAHLFLIVSRGIAISLFATEFYLNVFIIGAAHYLLMVYWMYKQDKVLIVSDKDNSQKYSQDNSQKGSQVNEHATCCARCGFEWLAAIFNIFFPFRLQRDSFSFIVSYYIVFFFENLILILLWVVSVDYTQNLWYLEAAPITVVLGFLLGIALLLLYHFKCEPKAEETTDFDDEESFDYYSASLHGSIMVTSTLNRLYVVTDNSNKKDS